MPPQTEITPPNPIIPQPEGLEQPKKRLNKRKLLIIIGAVLAVITLLAVIRTHNLNQHRNKTSTADSSIYHFRPGYDVKEYGSTIGDPLALNMTKYASSFKTTKGPIVYACNVVTLGDLTSNKIYLRARADDRAIIRNFVDGVGRQSILPEPYTVNTGDKGNSCSYSLAAGGLLDVEVYQQPFTTISAIQDELQRQYKSIASVGGLKTYKDKDDLSGTSSYMLTSGNDAVLLRFGSVKISDSQKQTLLAAAAKNLVAQQKHSNGPAIPAYDSPTYKKKWARACDFISNSDIKTLTGTDASIYANEGLASGTGVEKANDRLYNSITTSCARFNTDLGSGLVSGPFDQKLEVLITSYQEDAPAKAGLQDVRSTAKDALAATVGDEGVLYKDGAGQNTLLFRQGRFVVEVVFDRVVQSNAHLTDPQTMLTKLTPYAQATALKLKALE